MHWFKTAICKYIMLCFLVLAAALAGGCGDKPDEPITFQGEGEQEVSAADESTADEDGVTAVDLPTKIGSRLVYAANKPGTGVDVSFDLDGPWDFTDGPDSLKLTIAQISKETAPGENRFPDATIAARSSWEPRTDQVEYSFQEVNDQAWLSYGHSGRGESMVAYSSPSRILIFPASVGRSWVDVYDQTENGKVAEIVAENSIVAYNKITVPAGAFPAYLLQRKITSVTDGSTSVTWDYLWIVPGIGMAAEMVSMPGERLEAFRKAYSYYRLKEY